MGGRELNKVGIFGHYGNGNLGDEAIIAAVIQSVRRHAPQAMIVGFCVNPADTEKRHGIQAFNIRRAVRSSPAVSTVPPREASPSSEKDTLRERVKKIIKSVPLAYPAARLVWRLPRTLGEVWRESRFLFRAFRTLDGVGMLIISGSGQLMDGFGGAWAFPYTLFKWSVMARLRGIKLVFLSVGAGPINATLSRFFIRRALRLAHYRSYRDEYSKGLIESIGVRGDNYVYPDLACNLAIARADIHPRLDRKRVVGIIPVPYFDHRYWQKSDAAKYAEFVQRLAQFSLWLIERGYTVFPFWTKLYTDELVVHEIERAVRDSGHLRAKDGLISRPISTLADMVDSVRDCDLLVASRFHGILIPLIMQKPVVGLAYHPKTSDMMAYMGQPDYCLNIDHFTLEDLQKMFVRLEQNAAPVSRSLSQRASDASSLVEEQYRRIFDT
ncbi:hypothetical protein C3F09_03180 [candidate division GN15 bacterium]|uniref:Polysaccharide pyruvyl transferase domain-containing protein n=1 Tax=candidate division GN15 bacterium TaxID=2072418 RepID=A0A855X987_9BACT|nr:MAG: hypothetical protein C3F09_03180 [candidate division GN15 bacterium]